MPNDELEDFVSPDYQPPKADCEEVKEELPKLFDYINDLSFKKTNLAQQVQDEIGQFPSEFVSYIATKSFGNFPDTVLLANIVNTHFGEIPVEAQYLFYLYGVPKRKRFAKFYSPDASHDEEVAALAKYFRWGTREARANLKMFSKEELKEIIRRTNGNGTKETGSTRNRKRNSG